MGQCHSAPSTGDDEIDQRGHCEETTTSSLKKRCLTMAKEQRSRFYILRRCVIMLLCWQKYGNKKNPKTMALAGEIGIQGEGMVALSSLVL
ncbi:Uncharacterized protein TCM_030235 [Theobroma cacao]|uniref:DVL family protein n=1 Tax=Theobroma cacao TaxID=3641 RepID=A0A061GH47_THECC|nr:Uncharacterized protein TCM_030235 [Theobroma cacao]